MRKHLILLAIILLCILGYNYIYKDHRNIKTEHPVHVLASNALAKEFSSNTLTSEKKYLNKTIEISGEISEISNQSLVLDDKIFCQFQNPIKKNLKLRQPLIIKGRYIGYDNLIEEIKLDQCIIIN